MQLHVSVRGSEAAPPGETHSDGARRFRLVARRLLIVDKSRSQNERPSAHSGSCAYFRARRPLTFDATGGGATPYDARSPR
ncbi:MAG: hypothetical protein BJ554DRAFT_5923 [Olpidium bornovanus]|uniref:Uncharacterized protein n=1 Tax=Olpidium bornovanus TaxID=278681 RepID=A0A8H8DL36_9FUNG|nr:MAG: hypothetical protein BJ554DRAFT_5923 [Olpidium bornovanus]